MATRSLRKAALGLALLLAAGAMASCSAEEVFVDGRMLDDCVGGWPVCSTTAGCVLDEHDYLEGSFPGGRRFIVRSEGPALLTVSLLLQDQLSAGNDTELRWYEPGCFERYVESTAGRDIFRKAGEAGIYDFTIEVLEAGDHLVEIYSDAYCTYLLKVSCADGE